MATSKIKKFDPKGDSLESLRNSKLPKLEGGLIFVITETQWTSKWSYGIQVWTEQEVRAGERTRRGEPTSFLVEIFNKSKTNEIQVYSVCSL